MALSKEMAAIIEGFRRQQQALASAPSQTIAQRRAGYEQLMARYPLASDVLWERQSLGGVGVECLKGPWADPDHAILYLHGGGYSLCSPRTHRELASRIGRAAGATVYVADYRLAPEFAFPAALEDSISAYTELLARFGGDSTKLAVAGDSAGGGLSLALLIALRDRGLQQPVAASLLSPWLDLTLRDSRRLAISINDPVLTVDRMEDAVFLYVGDHDPNSPLISPIGADLSGLSPMLVQVGSAEAFVGEARRLKRRADQAGADVELEVWHDMIHVWHAFPHTREGVAATDAAGTFLRRCWVNSCKSA